MKVVLVNTYEQGGAGVACKRLLKALKLKAEVKMLVREKKTADADVIPVSRSRITVLRNKLLFFWERLMIGWSNGFLRKNLFAVSLGNTGIDISGLQAIQDADVIHLHWINQGMLSLHDIEKLVKLGKPVVWTMHDMWEFTGICHYAGNCRKFEQECGWCPFLKKGENRDWSYKVLRRKQRLFNNKITFVACSNWLAGCARKSSLLKGMKVISVPNPIDVNVFSPQSKPENKRRFALSENKTAILFGAAKLSDPRKGYSYFCRAMELFARRYPLWNEKIELVFLGDSDVVLSETIPYQIRKVGYLSGEAAIAALYNAVDVFVIPSLEDNLPNTVMEAMACGIPVVGFATGGIPQMIDHLQNGYVAGYASCEDLMKGIYWVLCQADTKVLSENARQKVMDCFSEKIVADRFYQLYSDLLYGK